MIYTLIVMSFIICVATGFTFGLMGRLALWLDADSRASYACKYKPMDDDNCHFETGCGEDFYNAADDGDYVTSWMNYCPYCGGKAKQLRKSDNT
ncbi:hypothetical protein [Pseudoalteromonas virus vB_PspP-H6/1]|nr:hypothetical protein [Pseudoalteromonas virus vB_PspP-H6/1]